MRSLIVGRPGGGTVDKYAPNVFINIGGRMLLLIATANSMRLMIPAISILLKDLQMMEVDMCPLCLEDFDYDSLKLALTSI